MPLTSCMECNAPISESAQSCPGCSTRHPFGVDCELCGGRLRYSAGASSVRNKRGYRYLHSDVAAHHDCLKRYYTAPATPECLDCGLRFADSDLGFTPLRLWRATNDSSHAFTCPRCGRVYSLTSVQCTWKRDYLQCERPLYPFQVGPNAPGHGHAEHKLDVAVTRARAEQQRAQVERARSEADQKRVSDERERKKARNSLAMFGFMGGGVLGFFIACFLFWNVQNPSIGIFWGMIVLFAVLGAAAGMALFALKDRN
jgi:hypothetical protein